MAAAVKFARSHTPVPIGARKSRKVTSPVDKAKGNEIVWEQVSGLFAAARSIQNPSFVYLIGEADGPLKIGVSKDPIARLRGMQTGNPRRLRIEYAVVGHQPLEKLLHEFWEHYAICTTAKRRNPDAAPGTEWFRAEIRTELSPIIETAVEAQTEALWATTDKTVSGDDMEQIVRNAHIAHGFIATGRDQVQFLAPAAGYTRVARPSRI